MKVIYIYIITQFYIYKEVKKYSKSSAEPISSGDQMLAIDPTIATAQLSSLLLHAPAGNRTRVCTVAGYYSTTRPLVLVDIHLPLIL